MKFVKDLVKYIQVGKTEKLKKQLWTLILIYLGITILEMLVAISMGDIIQEVFMYKKEMILYNFVFFVCGKFVVNILEFVAKVIDNNLKECLIVCYRTKTMNNILKTEYKSLKKIKIGDILGRMQEDVELAAEIIAINLVGILKSSLIAIAVGFFLFLISKVAFVAYIVSIPLILITYIIGTKKSEKYLEQSREIERVRDAKIQDILYHKFTIKSFDIIEVAEKWIQTIIDKYIKSYSKAMMMVAALFSPSIIIGYMPLLITCCVCGHLVIKDYLSLGTFVAILLICKIGTDELQSLIGIFVNLPGMIAQSSRLFEFWNMNQSKWGKEVVNRRKVELKFQDVSFSYDGKKILNHFNLSLQKGDLVVLAGKSGCGKSTILKLAAGLYDTDSGEVLYNNTPIRKLEREFYLKKIGYIAQGGQWFSNLKKSGGEKQKAEILELLNSEHEILLIDEGTSALDQKTEQEIMELLKKCTDCIILMVAHREKCFEYADRVIWIETVAGT